MCVLQGTMTTNTLAQLSDEALIAETKRLATNERLATAALIRSLVELDARRLYLGQGCGTLFKYCTEVLHLSEDAAYNRVEVADAARRIPQSSICWKKARCRSRPRDDLHPI